MKHFVKILFSAFIALVFVSCGGTTVKVKQSSDGVNATVSVQTNNPTNVDVTPSVSVKLDDISDLLNMAQDSLEFDESGEMIIGSNTIRKIIKLDYIPELLNLARDSLEFDDYGEIVIDSDIIRNIIKS